MIRNKIKMDEFSRMLVKNESISHKEALLIYESLYKEAISLGAINSKNILDGLEIDIRIARAINGLSQ